MPLPPDPDEIYDTQPDSKVKSKIIPDTPRKRQFSVQLQGQFLLALEDYAKKRSLTPNQAFRELIEFRLVETGDLPSWWLERKRARRI